MWNFVYSTQKGCLNMPIKTISGTSSGTTPKATDQDIIDQSPNAYLTASVVIDEDNMLSDSNVRLPTQQSVVAYVSNQLAGGVTYRGALDIPADLTTNTTGNSYADSTNEYKVGDLFVTFNGGVLTLSDGNINVSSGDTFIINTNTPDAGITVAMVDHIQATNPSEKIFTGDFKQSARSSNHGGWLLCNGLAVSRTTYLALFNEIGTSFGVGDGSTTFNLPDFRGKVFGGIDGSHPLGQLLGSETSTLSTANLPPHTHSIDHDHPSFTSGSGGQASIPNGGYGLVRKSNGESVTTDGNHDVTTGEPDLVAQPSGWSHTHSIDVPNYIGTSGSTGSSSPFSILQPTLYGGNIFIYSGV